MIIRCQVCGADPWGRWNTLLGVWRLVAAQSHDNGLLPWLILCSRRRTNSAH
jgi:hypothetical protein